MAILIVYVDDIVLTEDDDEEIDKLKNILEKEFKIKDLRSLKYFLGMKIAWSRTSISVSQHKYVMDLMNEIEMLDCKPANTPMDYT